MSIIHYFFSTVLRTLRKYDMQRNNQARDNTIKVDKVIFALKVSALNLTFTPYSLELEQNS